MELGETTAQNFLLVVQIEALQIDYKELAKANLYRKNYIHLSNK